MLKTITYEARDGTKAVAAFCDGGSAYALAGKRERFAQLMARGKRGLEAYLEAFDMVCIDQATTEQARESVADLLHDTTVVLRIQELKKPVVRAIKKKLEYNLQKALEQCQVAYDLAYAQGDSKGLLAAIKMQADLMKLLSQEVNVTHRYGVLDDASTEVLLEMRKRIESAEGKRKKMGVVIEGEIRSVPEEGGGAASGPIDSGTPMAVPN